MFQINKIRFIVMDLKKDDGINREKQLKREVEEMRRELEDAFGLSKII
jgi:hypothetical protein